MEKKLGLYVSVSGDGNLKRTLVSVSGEIELEATTLNDEVILFSELNYSCYAFIVDRIKLAFQFLLTRDKDGTSAVDLRVFEFIQDTVQDLIEEFEIDNPMYGTLTRTLEFSFISKMLHTIDPSRPIYDSQVDQALQIHRTYEPDIELKIQQDEEILKQISFVYQCLEASAEMAEPLAAFDQIIPSRSMSIAKKLDFLLWALGGIEKK